MAERSSAWVQFDDLTVLQQTLSTAGDRSKPALQDMLVQVGEQMAARMRELVPVRTGRLKADIRVLRQGQNVIVGATNVPYAAHVEFGTGRRGELTNGAYLISRGRVLRLPPKETAGIPGQRAQPYVRPAAAEFVASLGPKAANVGLAMVVGEGRLSGTF
jgi:HK97 gp10 family phage protein